MYKKIIFVFPLLSLFYLEIAGQPILSFEKTTHDFGEIIEGNIAKYDFQVKNTGNQPLIINNVRASCGCTSPYWTKEPILPGKTGLVSAAFNSKNRPGVFRKSLTVVSNAEKNVETIYIKGIVVESTNLTSQYTESELQNSPRIITPDQEINLGKIEKGQQVPFSVIITNKGFNDLIIKSIRAQCNCVIWDNYQAMHLVNMQAEELKLIYHAKQVGERNDELIIYSNDLHTPKMKILLKAQIVESLTQDSMIKQNDMLKF